MTFRALVLGLLLAVGATSPAAGQVVFEGRVTDAAGNALADADLDFFETQSGRKVDPSAPGWESQSDKTDSSGRYRLVVIPDVYDVRYEPPVSRTDVAPAFSRELILGSDTVHDVQLPFGVRITGHVSGPDGTPAAGVDLDMKDPATGLRLATVDDDTDANGNYALTVEAGVWDVVFQPPAGLGAAATRLDSQNLTFDRSLDVTLPRGWVVSGRVVREGDLVPVRFTDIDFEDPANARRLPATDDAAGLDGHFAATVREGEVHVFLIPPLGFPLAPTARWHVTVDQDIDLGDVVLVPGVVLSGTIEDPGGSPVPDADLDLFLPGTCDRYPLASGGTNGSGAFSMRIEPDTWDLVVNPPAGAAVPANRFESLPVESDSLITLRLDALPPPVAVSGVVTDEAGDPVTGATIVGTPETGALPWEAVTDAAGAYSALAGPGRHRIEISPPPGRGLATRRLDGVDLPCGLDPVFVLPGAIEPTPSPARRPVRITPNPWTSETRVQLQVAARVSDALVTVHDVAGRRVRVLHRGALEAGAQEIPWDGRNSAGVPVASGVYFVRAELGAGPVGATLVRIRP
jgi:protocatechuate 3,4-dioxygenase beta subunit